jgi:hypothetical protein
MCSKEHYKRQFVKFLRLVCILSKKRKQFINYKTMYLQFFVFTCSQSLKENIQHRRQSKNNWVLKNSCLQIPWHLCTILHPVPVLAKLRARALPASIFLGFFTKNRTLRAPCLPQIQCSFLKKILD